jgi:hypothetical protein
LLNKDESNVFTDTDQKRKIALALSDLPGTFAGLDGSATKEVYEEGTLLYVSVYGQKVYIRRSVPTTADDVPAAFEFYVNPHHITPSYRKLTTEVRTRGAWEIQHWGNALTEIRVQGKTGGVNRNRTRPLNPGQYGADSQTLGPGEDITTSPAWQRLNQLKQLYETDHNLKNQEDAILLGMNYYDRFYIGYFTEFTGPEADAQSPYLMTFAFTFKVQEESSLAAAIQFTLGGTL